MSLPYLELWFGDLADDNARAYGRVGRERPREVVTDVESWAERVSPADRGLIERVRNGDEGAYVELYEAYMYPLAQFALHLTRDPAAAEEIAAHVLSAIWIRRDRWIVRSGIDAYLFGAVRNRVITLRQNAARRGRIERELASDDYFPTLGVRPESPDAALEDAEWSERLHAAILTLPERYRYVAFLRWKRGLEYEQIGRVLGLSEGTARQLVSRTLRALRGILGV